ncbi:MAG: hypothetical protein SFW35_04660 [Chitinophagales bacterium]|nr:hypothetical protein [Chitinophagales bacterium]
MKSFFSYIIVFCSFIFFTSCCNETEVCYIEKVPYTAIEEWNEDGKYEVLDAKYQTDNICLEKGFFGLSCTKYRWFVKTWAIIKNVDKEPGSFAINQTFETLARGVVTRRSESKTLQPGESYNFIVEYDLENANQDYKVHSYSVIPPKLTRQKQVTKFQNIKRYRKCNSCNDDCKNNCDSE